MSTKSWQSAKVSIVERRANGVLSTPSMAAYLTRKQHDLLLILQDGTSNGMSNKDVSASLLHLKYEMELDGAEIEYRGYTPASAGSSLRTLWYRDLVDRIVDPTAKPERRHRWILNRRGRQALRILI